MRTRPHIVTQTHIYDTTALCRNADLIAARMGAGVSLQYLLGYSRVLIRLMKIILDLTLHNNCYIARREVLESPRLRKLVTERIGGAHALLRWRRQNTWNKARLAAIASGEYQPAYEPPAARYIPPTAKRPKPQTRRAKLKTINGKFAPAHTGPSRFRLPALQNLRYVHRHRISPVTRAPGQTRMPCIVLWPHELDGQYVPNFKSRASRPDAGGYERAARTDAPAGHAARPIFAPP